MPSERDLVAHLLRRAGFGAFPDAHEYFVKLGFDATLAWLLDDEQPEDPAVARLREDFEYNFDFTVHVKRWWLHLMLITRRPLRERMAFFWHGHFATAARKVGDSHWMAAQIELFREQGLGSFRDLVRAVTYDKAMLRWLDLSGSHRRAPNENYARELMELFALGHGNYTERDIKEAARALTGWRIDRDEVVFHPSRHDSGTKTFLGASGRLGSDDVIDVVVRQPASSRFIARKLFTFFVYDDPEPAVVERFALVFEESDLSIRALVEAILRSPEFRSDRAFHAKVKSPVDLVIGAMKDLNVRSVPRNLNVVAATQNMGQEVLDPPSVKGWDGGTAWLSAGWFIARTNFVAALLDGRWPDGRRWVDGVRLANVLENGWDPYSIAEHMARRMLGADGTARVLELVTQGTGQLDGTGSTVWRERRIRTLLSLVTAAPAYQYL